MIPTRRLVEPLCRLEIRIIRLVRHGMSEYIDVADQIHRVDIARLGAETSQFERPILVFGNAVAVEVQNGQPVLRDCIAALRQRLQLMRGLLVLARVEQRDRVIDRCGERRCRAGQQDKGQTQTFEHGEQNSFSGMGRAGGDRCRRPRQMCGRVALRKIHTADRSQGRPAPRPGFQARILQFHSLRATGRTFAQAPLIPHHSTGAPPSRPIRRPPHTA